MDTAALSFSVIAEPVGVVKEFLGVREEFVEFVGGIFGVVKELQGAVWYSLDNGEGVLGVVKDPLDVN